MIDPTNPPKLPEATQAELQEFLMFAVAVAGKHAASTAAGIDQFLQLLPKGNTPFHQVGMLISEECFHLPCAASGYDGGHSQQAQEQAVASRLAEAGLGCYNQRAKTFVELHHAIGYGFLDIATCEPHALEKIWGIGRKTSRFFVMYTGPDDQEYAILDVHILSWLREQGYDAPKHTPRSERKYSSLENAFVWEAQARGMTPLELDAAIWTARSK